MDNLPRWFMVLVLVLAVFGLVWWARGPDHHHGDDVGAVRVAHVVSQELLR